MVARISDHSVELGNIIKQIVARLRLWNAGAHCGFPGLADHGRFEQTAGQLVQGRLRHVIEV